MDYKRIYDKIIDRANKRTQLSGYIEKHHIIPRCMGGSDESENLVELTPEEHFLCHVLLVKIYPEHGGLIYAVIQMCRGHKGKRKSRKLYGWLRRRFSEQRKLDTSGEKNPHHGSMWINRVGTTENKRIPKNEDIPSGWEKGRKFKPTEDLYRNRKRRRKCGFCGKRPCQYPSLCKNHGMIRRMVASFGFDKSTFGSEDFYDEYFRVVNLLKVDYTDNQLSVQDLCEKYEIRTNESMRNILKSLGIPRRKAGGKKEG